MPPKQKPVTVARIKAILAAWRCNDGRIDARLSSSELEDCIQFLRQKLEAKFGGSVVIAPRCGICFTSLFGGVGSNPTAATRL